MFETLYSKNEQSSYVKYVGNDSNVIIPEKVTKIEYQAFDGCHAVARALRV